MTSAAAPPAAAPRLDAEQVLTRLLGLIRETERVEQFTPQRLSAAFGVDFRVYEPGYWGYGERLSPRWTYGMEMREKIAVGPRFAFSFNAAAENAPAEEICAIDYRRFAAELEAMGFRREARHGEHGAFLADWFDRPGMRVIVKQQRLASGDDARACVRDVSIP
ncbi:hypothetical protein J5226_24370 [Lysobacter sp. K5869]|uniref:hypothetical protein n=1 Tax=Lysobacter sp. K5869 TaxID=2820808 RepID=UPI001C0618EF|nr:hypothetical protein [Lysobacter sp. K5869]QWP76674.1 hypothetical protein J5226_24370 [Lysobacter sp. K5869]